MSDETPASQATPPLVETHPPSPSATVPLAADAAVCDSPLCAAHPSTGSGLTGREGAALVCTSPRPSRRTSRTAFTAPPPEPDDPLLGFAPYLHQQPRRNAITPDRQRAFIATLAATGIVSQAARSIGASLEALYKLRHRPGAEEFSAAWDLAIDRGIARLEDCAVELAIAGEERPIVSAGQLLGTYRKHNFGHIRFVLSQRRGQRWNAEGAHFAKLVPGHPVYDRMRRAWEEERRRKELEELPAIHKSICDKLDLMRRRAMASGSYIEEFPDADDEAFLAGLAAERAGD